MEEEKNEVGEKKNKYNIQNLKPFTSEQDREKARESGRKGGIASGEAKRRRKTFAEDFKIALEQLYKDKDGKTTGQTNQDVIIAQAVKKAQTRQCKGFGGD